MVKHTRRRRWSAISPVWVPVLLVLSALAMSVPAAQCRVADINDFQTWWDITTIYNFNDRWRYDGDQGTRGIVSNEEWTLIYVRPSVRYVSRSWISLHGGVGFFYTDQESIGYRFEIRPWAGAKFIGRAPAGLCSRTIFVSKTATTIQSSGMCGILRSGLVISWESGHQTLV